MDIYENDIRSVDPCCLYIYGICQYCINPQLTSQFADQILVYLLIGK